MKITLAFLWLFRRTQYAILKCKTADIPKLIHSLNIHKTQIPSLRFKTMV
jgi:hypothetical protein